MDKHSVGLVFCFFWLSAVALPNASSSATPAQIAKLSDRVHTQGKVRAADASSNTAPIPNAFDDFSAAGALIVDADKITSYPVDIDEIANPPLGSTVTSAESLQAQQEEERIVTENAPALARLQPGLGRAYTAPPVISIYYSVEHLSPDRKLARLLEWRSEMQMRKGQWAAAMQSDIDALVLGRKIVNGPLVCLFVGEGCEEIGSHHAYEVIGHLSAGQAEAAARRIEEIDSQYPTFAWSMQQEEWTGQQFRIILFKNPDWLSELNRDDGTDMNDPDVQDRERALRDYVDHHGEQAVITNYVGYMRAEIARATLPYPSFLKTTEPKIPIDPLLYMPDDIVGWDRYVGPYCHYSIAQASRRLLMTSLSLRAYMADHENQAPATLATLVPDYLKTVPTDPFAPDQPLRYRSKPSGAAYLLYSIGPDCTNDGGSPLTIRDNITDAKGDIVAGAAAAS